VPSRVLRHVTFTTDIMHGNSAACPSMQVLAGFLVPIVNEEFTGSSGGNVCKHDCNILISVCASTE